MIIKIIPSFKLKLLLVLLWILPGMEAMVFGQEGTIPKFTLNENQIIYIYSKAFDIILTDKRTDLWGDNLPFNFDVVPFESIKFLISQERIDIKSPGNDTFNLDKANLIKDSLFINYEQITRLYDMELINLGRNYDVKQIGNQLSHKYNYAIVNFSNLYQKDQFIYLRVAILYYIQGMEFMLIPSESTFQIELCQDKYPLFKLGFYTLGVIEGKVMTSVFDLNSKECE